MVQRAEAAAGGCADLLAPGIRGVRTKRYEAVSAALEKLFFLGGLVGLEVWNYGKRSL